MTVFEIIFILLLLIPVALLMRFFVSSLSRETPQQRRTRNDRSQPYIAEWRARKRKEREEEEAAAMEQERAARKREQDFVPRAPASMKRTERIPFTQIYSQLDEQLAEQERAGNTGYKRPAANRGKRRQ